MATVTRERELLRELVALVRGECPSLLNEDSGGDVRLSMAIDAALAAPPAEDAPAEPPEDARQDTLDRLARAVAKHAAAVTKAGLPHDSDHAIGEYRAILAAGKYPRSPMIYEAALAAPPDQPFTVINEDDGDVTIDFDYANDRVVSIRLGEESSGLSAFVDGESHALCPLDRVPPKVLALLRTSAKSVTLRQSDPPGLVELMARWQRAERAWQQAQDETGQVYEPEGLWEERHELFEAMLAYPLPASPQAETKGDE